MHVLLVHDPATSQLPLREGLMEAGAETLTIVRTAEEAITEMRERGATPELAVVDASVAGGLQHCRRLAARLREIPLLVVCAEDKIAAAYDEGADDCVVLPLRRRELVARARVARMLHAERERRAKRERRMSDEIRNLQRDKTDLERTVCVDALTGLANRRHALALLAAEWKRSARDGTPLSVVMVDLDAFHGFNETYGHLGGDQCLHDVTDSMVMCLRRPSDYLGRYGGEEFIAVLANTDAGGASIVAERMRKAVEDLAIPHMRSPCSDVVTISVGFATARPSLDSRVDDLVRAADNALLAAKAGGRNRVRGEVPTEPDNRPRQPSQPWRRFPVVIADPWFADRIPTFLAVARCELATFRRELEAGAFDRVRSLARSLKSSAHDHGIDTIVELANMIEKAARGHDGSSITRVVDELAEYIAHVQVTYRRPSATGTC